MDSTLSAVMELEHGPTQISMSGAYDREMQEANFEATISEFLLSDFRPTDSTLQRVQMPLSGAASVSITSQGKVTSLDLVFNGAKGQIDMTGVKVKEDSKPEPCDPEQLWACEGEYADPNVQPPPLGIIELDNVLVELSLDPETRRYDLRQLAVTGPQNQLYFVGGVGFVHDEESGELIGINTDVQGTDLALNIPGILADELAIDALELSLDLDLLDASLKLQKLAFDAYGAAGEFVGEAALAVGDGDPFSPALALSGRVRDLPIRKLIRFWPAFTGMGGRDWIRDNVEEGVVNER